MLFRSGDRARFKRRIGGCCVAVRPNWFQDSTRRGCKQHLIFVYYQDRQPATSTKEIHNTIPHHVTTQNIQIQTHTVSVGAALKAHIIDEMSKKSDPTARSRSVTRASHTRQDTIAHTRTRAPPFFSLLSLPLLFTSATS